MVAYRSSTTLAYLLRSSNTTVTAPSGIQNGDALFLFAYSGAGNPGPTDLTPPTGFSALPGFPYSTVDVNLFMLKCYAWTKMASGESGNYTITHASMPTGTYMAAFSQPNATTPLSPNPTLNKGTGTTTTFTGLTTAADASVIVTVNVDWGGSTNTLSPPSGTTPTFTERADNALMEVADGVLATAGATGSKTMTNNVGNGTDPWLGFMFALPDAGTPVRNIHLNQAVNRSYTY